MDDCKSYFLETGRRVSFEYTLLGTLTVPSLYPSVFGENIVELCLLSIYSVPSFRANMDEVTFVTSWDQ